MDIQADIQSIQQIWTYVIANWKLLASFAGIFCAVVVGAVTVHWLLYAVGKRVAARTESTIDDALIENSRRPARMLFILFGFLLVLPAVPLDDEPKALFQRLLTILLTAGIGWMAASLTNLLTAIVSERYDLTATNNLAARQAHTRVRLVRRLLVAMIFIITVCLILMSIPSIRQIGVTLFASAGLAGLVAGMAARPALSNLIAGIQLALTTPINLDDVVIVEGEWGWIEEISATYVVVRIWDLRRLVVPLSYFIENPFQNWTRKTADILGTVMIYTDYTAPVPALRVELHRILKATPMWDGKVWNLQVTNATDTVVELRALMSASSSGVAWDLRCHVREKLLEFLQREYPECLPKVRAELDGERREPSAAEHA